MGIVQKLKNKEDFSYQYDKAHAKQYNELTKKYGSSIIIYSLVFICLVSLAVWLFAYGKVWSIIVGVILAFSSIIHLLSIASFIFHKKESGIVLKQGENLYPAIVTKIGNKGIGILALARVKDNSNLHWELYSTQIKKLPISNLEVGQRVPVTCILYKNMGGFLPIPIAWGTGDESTLKEAEDKISNIEWEALSACVDRYTENKRFASEALKAEDVERLSLNKV